VLMGGWVGRREKWRRKEEEGEMGWRVGLACLGRGGEAWSLVLCDVQIGR
jgi:hypothetical protein